MWEEFYLKKTNPDAFIKKKYLFVYHRTYCLEQFTLAINIVQHFEYLGVILKEKTKSK